MIGEDKLIHFSGVAMGQACTIVLRGARYFLFFCYLKIPFPILYVGSLILMIYYFKLSFFCHLRFSSSGNRIC